jgi:hypothetical protein
MPTARQSRSRLGALLALGLLAPVQTNAAVISWGPTFVMDDVSDVSNPAGSTVHFAADFNSVVGSTTPGGDDVINGLPFTVVDQNIPGLLTTTIANGPSFNTIYHPGGTGDQDLDDLLDSHSYIAANPGTASFTIEGLNTGDLYQIQVIGIADSRACCAGRIYETDDGQGNFTDPPFATLQRGMFQSVLGTFTADSSIQTFQLRSLASTPGNNDPGMSGLTVLRLIPEPGVSILVLGGVLLGFARRRRQ